MIQFSRDKEGHITTLYFGAKRGLVFTVSTTTAVTDDRAYEPISLMSMYKKTGEGAAW